ncbi:consortin, connexin sorting protein b isoform X2 [Dunckerocampus dactyliophorus]|uniref:consortin, connexin sorting protein b isoform X2 n=1 Tax=Dunckerocampus dactyliophorus TaxID=161453 RepID=UPI002404D714|nr:consortin, connexin sorting protein b isoform X2 [Dunckerocampus dactyliophorus]
MKEKFAKVTEVMGNKNTSPDPGSGQKEDDDISIVTGSVSTYGASSLSPELLASLQSLGENTDYTLLPHSLHQIAEACSLQEDYQLAIQLLQLEKLYHERVLYNLTVLQENWESQWKKKSADNCLPAETDNVSQKHIRTLRHLCRTHLKPSISEAKPLDITLTDIHSEASHQGTECESEITYGDDEEGRMKSKEEDINEEETYEEAKEAEDDEEEVKVEWPAGVPQASDKDLDKLSYTDGSLSPDGLVSILKRRRASLDGLPPPSDVGAKLSSKRKVRFSEPEDGIEQDEVSGDSCLILLLLCLVTVVISIGGTALYCSLVDRYFNICTDFTLNVDFFVTNVRRFFEGLGHWLPHRT